MSSSSTIQVKPSRIDEIALFDKLSIAPGIRQSSRKSYKDRLEHLERICAPANIESIFMNPDRTLK